MSISADQVSNLELGRIYMLACDLNKATEVLESVLTRAIEKNDIESISKALPLVLRIYAERYDFERIEYWKSQIKKLNSQPLENHPALLYVYGVIATYAGELSAAETFFADALVRAAELQMKPLRQKSALGLAILSNRRDQHEKALNQLNDFLMDTKDTEVYLISNALILKSSTQRELKLFCEAEKTLLDAQKIIPTNDIFTSVLFFFAMGCLYHDWQRIESARNYFNLAKNLLNDKFHVHILKKINLRLERIKNELKLEQSVFLIESASQVLLRTHHGEFDLTKQALVLEVLKLFIQRKGQVIDKAGLVRAIWKEEYNPLVHDNKIYVTINRLRKVLEVNSKNPKFLIQKNSGYFWNPHASFIHLQTEEVV